MLMLVTGRPVTFWVNASRALYDTPAPYDTRLGTGNREVQLPLEWLVSTFLSGVINDPKNAASKVPACGELRLKKSETRFVTEAIVEGENRLFGTPERKHVTQEQESHEDLARETVFETIKYLATSVAESWDGPFHQGLRAGFRLTINLSPSLFAEMVLPIPGMGQTTGFMRMQFSQPEADDTPHAGAIPTQATIVAEHIEMLARLYADTLARGTADATGLLPDLTLPVSGASEPSDLPTNDNAGILCNEAPASSVQPSATPTDGFPHRQKDAREKKDFQGQSVRLAGRPPSLLHGADHERHRFPLCAAGAG